MNAQQIWHGITARFLPYGACFRFSNIGRGNIRCGSQLINARQITKRDSINQQIKLSGFCRRLARFDARFRHHFQLVVAVAHVPGHFQLFLASNLGPMNFMAICQDQLFARIQGPYKYHLVFGSSAVLASFTGLHCLHIGKTKPPPNPSLGSRHTFSLVLGFALNLIDSAVFLGVFGDVVHCAYVVCLYVVYVVYVVCV